MRILVLLLILFQFHSAIAAIKCSDMGADRSLLSIESVKSRAKELADEALKECRLGVVGTAKFCVYSVRKLPGVAYSVWKYSPTAESFKNEISYPLADILVAMKGENESQSAKFAFILFWPEVVLKIQKSIPSYVVGVSYNTALNMVVPSVSKNPGITVEVAREVRKVMLETFWSSFRENSNLSITQRLSVSLKAASQFDSQYSEIVAQVKSELGFDRLEEALALYR